MVEKILNNTTPYGKIRASHEGSLHSSTLTQENTIVRNQSCSVRWWIARVPISGKCLDPL